MLVRLALTIETLHNEIWIESIPFWFIAAKMALELLIWDMENGFGLEWNWIGNPELARISVVVPWGAMDWQWLGIPWLAEGGLDLDVEFGPWLAVWFWIAIRGNATFAGSETWFLIFEELKRVNRFRIALASGFLSAFVRDDYFFAVGCDFAL